MKNINFLFCRNPLEPKFPDFGYENEYGVIRTAGYSPKLFDFDSFISGENVAMPTAEADTGMIYRGWMMKPEIYERFYEVLSQNRCILVNSPKQYRFCHTLPGWYDVLSDFTPKSRWTEDLSDAAIMTILHEFGDRPVIIKDYVKSRKHEWLEACFIPDASNTKQAMQVIRHFLDRQGDDLVGGLVVREFVNLKEAGLHPKSGMPISEEYRAFFLDGKQVCIIDYWNGTSAVSVEIKAFADQVAKKVQSNFFTVDIARTADDKLIAMEIGDGQVSGLQGFSEMEFYRKLFDAMGSLHTSMQ